MTRKVYIIKGNRIDSVGIKKEKSIIPGLYNIPPCSITISNLCILKSGISWGKNKKKRSKYIGLGYLAQLRKNMYVLGTF